MDTIMLNFKNSCQLSKSIPVQNRRLWLKEILYSVVMVIVANATLQYRKVLFLNACSITALKVAKLMIESIFESTVTTSSSYEPIILSIIFN